MTARLPALLLSAVLALGACSDATKVLQDASACPGESCTEDTQDRYDAIAALDDVTEVESVARTYGLDKGAASTATVSADVTDTADARRVALAVLGELDDWPDHEASTATATVRADPAVQTEYVARQSEDLTNPYFEPCSPAECENALAALQQRMRSEVEGLRDVRTEVRGGVLRITGTADPDRYALAAADVHGLVFDTAVRLADRLEVEVTAAGPLVLTLRMRDGRVCEEPPGTTTQCHEDDATPQAAP